MIWVWTELLEVPHLAGFVIEPLLLQHDTEAASFWVILEESTLLCQCCGALCASRMGSELIGNAFISKLGSITLARTTMTEAITDIRANLAWLVSERVSTIAEIASRILCVARVDLHVHLSNDKIPKSLRILTIKVRHLLLRGVCAFKR